ncbi:hypothetical protein JCM3770_000645 [Rhodotorula araucariae]
MTSSTTSPTAVPPSAVAEVDVDVDWGVLLGSTAPRVASTSCAGTPPLLPTSPDLSAAASFPTPASLPCASPISRTYSQTSASSTLQAALATLKSPLRKSPAQRKRSNTAHLTAPYPAVGGMGSSAVNPAAPTLWRGQGFPSVLLRSASDTACPTQVSLAPPADLPGTALTSSPFLPDYAPPKVAAPSSDDIIVEHAVGEHADRKPKKNGRKPAGHVPRPMNSFMLYRSAQLKELEECREVAGAKLQQSDLSRLIAAKWRDESVEVREQYTRRALEEKELHALRYPDYAFRPKATRRSSAKVRLEATTGGSLDVTDDLTLPTPPPAPLACGLAGSNPLSELLTAIDFSGFGSPVSPTASYDGFPTTPSTATSGTFDAFFLPPSSVTSDAWTTFRSSPLVWMDLPPVQQAASLDFCPPPQSAPACLTSFDFALTPPPSTVVETTPLPTVTDATLLPPAPMTYEDLLASVPLAAIEGSSLFPSSPDAPSPDNSLKLTTLDTNTFPPTPGLASASPSAPASASTPQDFDLLFQQFAYPSP